MSVASIAALPMYDFPALRAATDAFWSALALRLRALGVEGVPDSLTRDLGHAASWRDPRLLLGQACQYPLAIAWREHVRLIAVPAYAAPGCQGSRYCSALVVRREDAATMLADLRGRRCAVNELDSNSGANLLRAAVAPLASGGRFFGSVSVTGAHLASVRAVAGAAADVAAIDCVSYAHMQRLYPELTGALRVLAWSDSSPGLPYVTARSTGPSLMSVLKRALREVFEDRALDSVRAQLLLTGLDFEVDESYTEVLALERAAAERGYPALA